MAIDYEALETASYGKRAEFGARPELSPEILGRIIACAWQVAGSPKGKGIGEQNMFEFLVEEDLPSALSNILHFERRADGNVYIEERTRLMTGAQAAGLVGRLNPSHVVPIEKTDLLQANILLKQYAIFFPDEVSWIEQTIERKTQQPAVA
jgi:hypothetical protein